MQPLDVLRKAGMSACTSLLFLQHDLSESLHFLLR
jgi:hypothetical protein